MWLAFALASAGFAGATSILAKIGVRDVDSNLATALRTVVVLLFSWLMVFVVGSQHTLPNLSPHNLLFLVLSGLATGASWLCYFRALQLGDVNKVTPVDKSSTILTILLAFLLLGEPLGIGTLTGMVLLGAGTLLMIERKPGASGQPQSQSWLFFALLAALFAALTAILGKVGIQGVDSTLGTAIRTIVVLLLAWGIVLFQKKLPLVPTIDRKSWVFIGLSGLATGLSWLCYYRALQDGPASIVVPLDKLSIVVTVAFAWLFLKEPLTRKSLAGLALIVLGTLLLLV